MGDAARIGKRRKRLNGWTGLGEGNKHTNGLAAGGSTVWPSSSPTKPNILESAHRGMASTAGARALRYVPKGIDVWKEVGILGNIRKSEAKA